MPEKQGIKCTACGRTPVFGAQFCPYCGTRLAPAESGSQSTEYFDISTAPTRIQFVIPNTQLRGAQKRPLPTPDRASLTGRCAVLFSGEGPLDIRKAGRIAAEALKRPLGDVTRTMKVSRGIISDGIEADQARALAQQLEAEGIPTLLIPDDDLHNLPRLMRMKSAGFGREGIRCEAYLWDTTEQMSIAWHNVLLASCGRLNLSEVSEVDSEPIGEAASAKHRRLKLPARPEIPKLSTESWHEYVMDIFCLDPWLRLRLDENTSAYALVDVGSLTEGKKAFYKAASQIIKLAPDVPVNEGVRLLANNAPAELWESVIFEDKRDFDRYNMWLLQLARHGHPIGA